MLGWGGCWWEKGERLTFRKSRLNRVISLWKMKPASLLGSGFSGFCHLYLSFILKQRPHWTRFISIFHQNVLLVIRRESFLFPWIFLSVFQTFCLQKESEWYQLTYLGTILLLKGLSPWPGLRITGEASFYLPINRIPLFPGIPCGLNLLSQKQRTPQWQQKVISISLAIYIVSKALPYRFSHLIMMNI